MSTEHRWTMTRGLSSTLRDAVRTQLWPLPVLGVVLALVLGVAVPKLDRHADDALPAWLRSVLFSGDPGAARTVLDAVSSSLITVTSLTFSLTVVTLQLASSQYSPRLLRTFTSDMFVQATLALFLATFTFSLTVLRSVRSAGESQADVVPRIAVSVSFVLAVLSVVGLVVFLAHLARQIRVETMLRDVHAGASTTIAALLAPAPPARTTTALTRPQHAHHLLAASSGFLVGIDEPGLLRSAVEAGVDVVLDRQPGASLVAGTPIGSFWSSTGPLGEDEAADVSGRIVSAVRVGFERTAAQDVAYGLRQLTDVANKALSPGVNDPTTAVHALGHISAVLCELTERDLGPVVLHDEDDRPRVRLNRPDLGDLVEAAIAQPRRYGGSDAQVVARLLQLLEELAWRARPQDRGVVASQLERTTTRFDGAGFDAVELERLRRAAADVVQALARTG